MEHYSWVAITIYYDEPRASSEVDAAVPSASHQDVDISRLDPRTDRVPNARPLWDLEHLLEHLEQIRFGDALPTK
jgi:hypothetical protein